MTEPIVAWKGMLWDHGDVSDADDGLRLTPRAHSEIELRFEPDIAVPLTINFSNYPNADTTVSLRLPAAVSRLTLEAVQNIGLIRIQTYSQRSIDLNIDAEGHVLGIEPVDASFSKMKLANGFFYFTAVNGHHVLLSNAVMDAGDSDDLVTYVEAYGESGVTGKITVETLITHEGAVTELGERPKNCTRKSARADQHPWPTIRTFRSPSGEVKLHGSYAWLGGFPSGTKVELSGGSWTLTGNQENLNIACNGILNLRGSHDGHRIEGLPHATPTVHLIDGVVFLNAQGRFALKAEKQTLINGDAATPAMITAIESVEEAELDRVNLLHLEFGSLIPLQRATRVAPWLPGLYGTRRLEALVNFKNDEQRAYYWRELTRIMADKHAPGNLQSIARFQGYSARLAASTSIREKSLLTVYRGVGFGECIGRPLVVYVVISAVLACLYMLGDKDSGTLRTLGGMLLAPLGILRAVDSEALVSAKRGTLELITVDLARIVGAALIAFSLLAARRLTRAE